jgi:CO/xanthine dehydrogenase Mo-binding subunit
MTQSLIGSARPHESAALHVAGAAPYTDDLPERAGTLHAALGLSPLAHGRLLGIDVARLRAQPGVVDVLSAADIPGLNDCGPLLKDEPILAEGELRYLGQPVFAVVAHTREQARRAARLARECIQAEPLPALLTIQQAHAAQQYVIAADDTSRAATPPRPSPPHRSAWPSSSSSAARSSSTWKARSATPAPRKPAACSLLLFDPAPQRDAASGGACAGPVGARHARGMPAHGRRLRRQGERSRRCLPAWPRWRRRA